MPTMLYTYNPVGSQILNKCPKYNSCGTLLPYWTDEPMPADVGVPTTISIYGSVASGSCCIDCRKFTKKIEVMRCSNSSTADFIYRYLPGVNGYSGLCAAAFCSMK